MIIQLNDSGSSSDEELVKAMKEGSMAAFDEIYNRYWEQLYNDTYKRAKNLELTEEIVQDVFASLWVDRATREIGRLYPYLYTSARYHIFSAYRKGKNMPVFEETKDDMGFTNNEADSSLNEKDLRTCIAVWMDQQPTKRGEVFRLKYVDELSTREISEVLNVSQKTVQNQLITAFNGLRGFLNKMIVNLTA